VLTSFSFGRLLGADFAPGRRSAVTAGSAAFGLAVLVSATTIVFSQNA